MFNNNQSFQDSKLGRKSPSGKMSFERLKTIKSTRQPMRLHSSVDDSHRTTSSRRVIMGLVLLHIVAVGGYVVFERYMKDDKKSQVTNHAPPSSTQSAEKTELALAQVEPKPAAVAPSSPPQPKPQPKPQPTASTIVTVTQPIAVAPAVVQKEEPAGPIDLVSALNSLGGESSKPSPAPSTEAAQPEVELEEVFAVVDSGVDAEVNEMIVHQSKATSTPTQAASNQQQATALRYHIVSGDSWTSIARKYSVSIADLKKANARAASREVLYAGEWLSIPQADGSRPVEEVIAEPEIVASRTYTVVSGDTLSGIARRHKMTLAQIISLNEFSDQQANRLRLGQKIKIKAD